MPLSDLGFPQSIISSPPSKARRALCLFSYGIYADKFLFSGVFAHRVGKPPTYGGGGPRSGGEGGLQLYNAVFVMYVYHAPTVTPLARHLPRVWEALSNTAKQEFICVIPVRNPISIPFPGGDAIMDWGNPLSYRGTTREAQSRGKM